MNKPLWQMTGEEFMFLSKSATSDSAPRFRRFGNAQIMSMKLTSAKAYTAAISATPSEVFSKLAGMGKPLMDYTTICC